MDKIIVYLDDAAYARQQLTPPTGDKAPPVGTHVPTHWVLVACAPRMTQHISKWVSHSARENWRQKWAQKTFEQIVPHLQAAGDRVTTVLAKGPLAQLTQKLTVEHSASRLLDARRPKSGGNLPPFAADGAGG